jgi:hypothetical protein
LEVIRSDIVFAQNWALLLKEADQELIFKATDKMKTYLYNFRPNEMPAVGPALGGGQAGRRPWAH